MSNVFYFAKFTLERICIGCIAYKMAKGKSSTNQYLIRIVPCVLFNYILKKGITLERIC
jgi:hypothetical protein